MRMLQQGFPFDTVQMPLNVRDATYHSFEQTVLPEANRRGVAALGMKSMGGSGEIIKHGVATPGEALRYAMSLPVSVTISGMDLVDVLQQNLAIARLVATACRELRQINSRLVGYKQTRVHVLYKEPEIPAHKVVPAIAISVTHRKH